MKQNKGSRRTNEIAREKLASILLFEISDPDLALVTLTGVEVSVALQRAKGRIRSILGKSLGWRVTPEIAFAIDTTTDEAERIAIALENVPATMAVEKDDDGYPNSPVEGEEDGGVE